VEGVISTFIKTTSVGDARLSVVGGAGTARRWRWA